MKVVCISILLLLVAATCYAAHLHPEKWYQQKWCNEHKGQVEVLLPDKTRCDCITDNNSIEFDFGPKWAEAIGQALYYSLQTNKRAGIVLILEKQGDYVFWMRLNTTILHFKLPIDVWEMKGY